MKGNKKLINVQFKNSDKAKRIPRWMAERWIAEDRAKYINKSLYKKIQGKKITKSQKRDSEYKNNKP